MHKSKESYPKIDLKVLGWERFKAPCAFSFRAGNTVGGTRALVRLNRPLSNKIQMNRSFVLKESKKISTLPVGHVFARQTRSAFHSVETDNRFDHVVHISNSLPVASH
jgi:hypothetical protein